MSIDVWRDREKILVDGSCQSLTVLFQDGKSFKPIVNRLEIVQGVNLHSQHWKGTCEGALPELDSAVAGASGKVAAVRRPCNGPDDTLVRLHPAQQLVQCLSCT